MKHARTPPPDREPEAGALPSQDRYTTGEMARLSNNTLRTVRFYEEAGILTPIGRTDGGHRVFKRSELDRLMLVSELREAGLSLEEIRVILDAKHAAKSAGAAADAAAVLLRGCIEGLHKKVAVLSKLTHDLEETLACTARCRACTSPELFPDRCGSCETLRATEPLPRAMRVVWSVGADAPSAQGATLGAAQEE